MCVVCVCDLFVPVCIPSICMHVFVFMDMFVHACMCASRYEGVCFKVTRISNFQLRRLMTAGMQR